MYVLLEVLAPFFHSLAAFVWILYIEDLIPNSVMHIGIKCPLVHLQM